MNPAKLHEIIRQQIYINIELQQLIYSLTDLPGNQEIKNDLMGQLERIRDANEAILGLMGCPGEPPPRPILPNN